MTEQEKREMVIKGLEICKEDSKLCFGKSECGYQSCFPRCWITHASDALALLKAQDPRVMTLEEAKEERACWIEERETGITYPAIYECPGNPRDDGQYAVFTIVSDADVLPEEFDNEDDLVLEFEKGNRWLWEAGYGIDWRCWTSRPTDEQRAAVKWGPEGEVRE